MRKDRIVKKLRAALELSEDAATDSKIIEITKGTHLLATVELEISIEDFSKAVKYNKESLHGLITKG